MKERIHNPSGSIVTASISLLIKALRRRDRYHIQSTLFACESITNFVRFANLLYIYFCWYTDCSSIPTSNILVLYIFRNTDAKNLFSYSTFIFTNRSPIGWIHTTDFCWYIRFKGNCFPIVSIKRIHSTYFSIRRTLKYLRISDRSSLKPSSWLFEWEKFFP